GRRPRPAGRLRRRGRVEARPGRQPVRRSLPGRARSPRRQRDDGRRRQRDRLGGTVTGQPVTGILYGVGVGPGDPELVTVKAARLIGRAEVVAYHAGRPGRSLARASAAPYLPDGVVEEELVYPVTRGGTDHPGGYQGAIDAFYERSAARLAAHLAAGRDVVLLAEGDPTLYSSFTHMQRRLTPRFRCVIVPGVTSVSATAAAAGVALVTGDETLTVLPASTPPEGLRALAGSADGLAFMKVRGDLDGVCQALRGAGRLDDALLVSRASQEGESVRPLREAGQAGDVPYMSMVLV